MPSAVSLRNKNSGDIRIMNVDKNSTNHADMVFALDNGGAGPVERMRIDSSGRSLKFAWKYFTHFICRSKITHN